MSPLCRALKAQFIGLIFCLTSIVCFSAGAVQFEVSGRNNAYIITVTGETDKGEALLEHWYKKAAELCGNKKMRVEPNNGQPIIQDTHCGDAVKIEQGIQSCERIKASVFGKVICSVK